MGIKGFHSFLSKRYNNIFSNFDPNHLKIDHLYIDANFLIHQCKSMAHGRIDKTTWFTKLFCQLDKLIHDLRPGSSVYIALDGVPPDSKILLQRSNRFKAMKSLMDRGRIRDGGIKDKNTSSVLSPGSELMSEFGAELENYLYLKLNLDPAWKHLIVILSNSNAPGEGEAKIMNLMATQIRVRTYGINCIVGGDADLVILCLIRRAYVKLYVINLNNNSGQDRYVRGRYAEGSYLYCTNCSGYDHVLNHCPGLQSRGYSTDDEYSSGGSVSAIRRTTANSSTYQFIDISLLRSKALNEILDMDRASTNRGEILNWDKDRVMDDLVVLSFFLGNDFLPSLFFINSTWICDLVKIYIQVLRSNVTSPKSPRYLVNGSNIDLDILRALFVELAKVEPNHLTRIRDKESIYSDSSDSEEEEEDDEILDSERHSQRGSQVDDVSWYYQKYFGQKNNQRDLRKSAASEYFRGIVWIFQYYFTKCSAWAWYYPYRYPPLAIDCASLDINDQLEVVPGVSNRASLPLKPLEHLTIVLNPTMSVYLPKDLGNLLIDSRSNIIDMYPIDFKLVYSRNQEAGAPVAMIPFIERDRLQLTTGPLLANLMMDEKLRNQETNADFIFVHSDHPLVKNDQNAMGNETNNILHQSEYLLGCIERIAMAPKMNDKITFNKEFFPRITINNRTYKFQQYV